MSSRNRNRGIDLRDTGLFRTSDVALVAWLVIHGIEPAETDRAQFPTTFLFQNNDSSLDLLVKDFQSGEAVGNILAFFRAYRRWIKEAKRED